MATVLSREDILAAKDTTIEFVAVPEWSSDPEAGVYVRGLSGTARDSFEMAMVDQRRGPKGKMQQEINLRNLRAKLLVRCIVDSDDVDTARQIFTLQDIEALGNKNGAALQRCYRIAQRLSGLSNEDVDELTISLGEDTSEGSGSASLLPSGSQTFEPSSNESAVNSSQSGSPSTDLSPSGIDA